MCVCYLLFICTVDGIINPYGIYGRAGVYSRASVFSECADVNSFKSSGASSSADSIHQLGVQGECRV